MTPTLAYFTLMVFVDISGLRKGVVQKAVHLLTGHKAAVLVANLLPNGSGCNPRVEVVGP